MNATAYATLAPLPDPAHRPEFYAGVPQRRALAWVADITLSGIFAALLLPFTFFTGIFYFPFLVMVAGFFLRWTTLAAFSATPGMVLTGIGLREGDGGPLSPRTALLHTLGYSLSFAIFPLQLVSAGLMIATRYGQGLSDMALGTVALRRML